MPSFAGRTSTSWAEDETLAADEKQARYAHHVVLLLCSLRAMGAITIFSPHLITRIPQG